MPPPFPAACFTVGAARSTATRRTSDPHGAEIKHAQHLRPVHAARSMQYAAGYAAVATPFASPRSAESRRQNAKLGLRSFFALNFGDSTLRPFRSPFRLRTSSTFANDSSPLPRFLSSSRHHEKPRPHSRPASFVRDKARGYARQSVVWRREAYAELCLDRRISARTATPFRRRSLPGTRPRGEWHRVEETARTVKADPCVRVGGAGALMGRGDQMAVFGAQLLNSLGLAEPLAHGNSSIFILTFVLLPSSPTVDHRSEPLGLVDAEDRRRVTVTYPPSPST